MKMILPALLVLFGAAGCHAPMKAQHTQSSVRPVAVPVRVTAVLEDIVYQARNLPISPDDPVPPVVPVAVFFIKTSSIEGPSWIAIACPDEESLEELEALHKGDGVSFTIDSDMFLAAGRSYSAGIGVGRSVFWAALEDVRPL